MSSVLAAVAQASTVTKIFAPIADARVEHDKPDSRFAASYLATRGGLHPMQSLLKFNVQGLTGAVVSARLRLWTTDGTLDGPAVFAAATTWSESTLTWNTKPLPLGSAAADIGIAWNKTWADWLVTPLVIGNGTISFILVQPSSDLAVFDSRDQAHPPQLVVTANVDPCTGVAGASCSDGDACTVGDTCLAGACVAGKALICNDSNPCTTDSCAPATGCTYTANTLACDADGSICTADACSNGVCLAGAPKNCDDANLCTTDACDQLAGCTHAATGGTCDADGSACTIDACLNGGCSAGAVKACDDGNTCTTDTCDLATGACVFTATNLPGCSGTPGQLIGKGATWRYLDDGSDQGSAWQQIDFADGAWSQGKAELGYGDGDEATVVGYGPSSTNKAITTWFRHTFVLNGIPLAPLQLLLKRDDGAVVYVNGIEVLRSNMPAGAIGFSTLASTAVEDDTFHPASVPISALKSGTNVLAVEVHQAAATSSDISFDCQLDGGCIPTEALETLCNGLDDDCDGVTDWLLPQGGNACTTTGMGACGQGFATCLDGVRTCLTPPQIAETKNGIDDNCDGQTDEATSSVLVPLNARVAVPPYMWSDSPGLVDAVLEVAAHIGLQASGPVNDPLGADWASAFLQLDQHALLILPGYVIGAYISDSQLQMLQAWVEAGGVLVVGKPSGPNLLGLCGIDTVTAHSDGTTVRVTPTAPAALWLDSLEERDIQLSTDPVKNPINIHTYVLTQGSGSVAFGTANAGSQGVGAVFVRRALGQGAVYTLGFDPLTFTSPRCYVNCFDPARDVLAMLLKGMAREATRGHYVLKHPVPGLQSGVVALTHDIDAPDAYNAGAWGDPGAPRMAQMEHDHGVHGSYMMTSDYVAGYWQPNVIGQLLKIGATVAGGHTIQHLDMTSLPVGDLAVTQATYDPLQPTLAGEILVNLQIVDALLPAGNKLRAFRAPYLAINTKQYDVLSANGIEYDASLAIGDTRTAFPVSCEREPTLQWKFDHVPMYTFPMSQEDGLGASVDGKTTRTELQTANQAQFLSRWGYALLQNAANRAWSVLLVHPSYGVGGVGPDNLAVKIDSVAKYIQFAQQQDVVIDDLLSLGDFWRARDETQVEAFWRPETGYGGQLTVGMHDAPHFTLEFGDDLAAFACPDCPAWQMQKNRVTFQQPLPAGAKLTFTATVP